MEGAIASTHQIIISKSLGQPTSTEFNLVNGRVGSATGIMLYTACALTAEALVYRYQKGGLKVQEGEQTIDYTLSDGRKWYEEESVKEASGLKTDNQLAFVYSGLPNPAAVVDFYVAHGEKHYGKLARDPILNTHTFGGIKTTKLDGSITLVFNNDKQAKAVAKTPRMLNASIKVGELNLNKAEMRLINGVCCRDDSCRAINGAHVPSCREKEIVGQSKAIKVSAMKKGFGDIIQANAQEVLQVRDHLKAQYGGRFCKGFSRLGVPCAGKCTYGPCKDWDELIGNELSESIYARMPDAVRRKPTRRGLGKSKENKEGPVADA